MFTANKLSFVRLAMAVAVLLLAACGPMAGSQVTPLATTPPLTTPTPTSPPPPTETPTVPPANCLYDSEFVSDVTIPDGTNITPGETFTKTWRLRNNGNCPWLPTFQLVQTGGEYLFALSNTTPLPEVQPGAQADLSVSLQLDAGAPMGSTQTAAFQMRDDKGIFFGGTPYVIVTVAATSEVNDLPTPTPISPASGTAAASGGSISGTVFVDFCSAASGSPPNCVDNGQGGKEANGVFDAGEKGLAGITVQLRPGACPGDPAIFSTAVTGSDGRYSFGNLPAGSRCVEVNALDLANQGILVPGFWTLPADVQGAVAQIAVTLTDNQALGNVNFGWDFQLD